ncbi:putative Squalene--hopene cyclase [Streptomyces afghaniensis 772]|uniref:Putative Squalene--hopene cyclase n=1 Tax=Streptomyces afghaniensis 772 TaxID=1283301 RepID=S4MVB1_9ACTN|nr:putative Squalene--hopene cyclase [Streptomyces afghaniensis 772]
MTATTDGSTGALPPRAAAASDTAIDNTTPAAAGVPQAAARAAQRATDFLLSLQDAQGWWKGDLETNVTMDAEDLMLRQFLGIRDEKTTRAAALFIRGEQREDGAWATFYGGPGELSATVEAYVALRLAGDEPGAPHMARASAWIREQGGIAAARVFTRIWLDAEGAGGPPGPVRRRGARRGPDDRGLPVAGVGHLPGRDRARGRRTARRPPAVGEGRGLDAGRGDRPAR